MDVFRMNSDSYENFLNLLSQEYCKRLSDDDLIPTRIATNFVPHQEVNAEVLNLVSGFLLSRYQKFFTCRSRFVNLD